MADAKRYYWLKMYDDFFGSKRIKKLRRLAGGDTFTIIYLKMQLKSLKTGGYLEYTGIENSFEEEIALDIDEDVENVKITVSYLISVGLLEVHDESTFCMPYVAECTGSESASTQRVREHRKRAKALQCNTDVTQVKQVGNAEIEKEKDTRDREREEGCDFNFNAEKAWNDTFAIYPKKSASATAKMAWMNKLLGVIPENQQDMAIIIYKAVQMYVADYDERNPEDVKNHQYIPKFDKWLTEDCDYWISVVEKGEKDV